MKFDKFTLKAQEALATAQQTAMAQWEFRGLL